MKVLLKAILIFSVLTLAVLALFSCDAANVICEEHSDENFDNFCDRCFFPLAFNYKAPNPDFDKARENLLKNGFNVEYVDSTTPDDEAFSLYEGFCGALYATYSESEGLFACYFESEEYASAAWESGLGERIEDMNSEAVSSLDSEYFSGREGSVIFFATKIAILASYGNAGLDSDLNIGDGSENNGEIGGSDTDKDMQDIPNTDPIAASQFLEASGFETDLVYLVDMPSDAAFDGLICGVEANKGKEYIVIFYFENTEIANATWENPLRAQYDEYEFELAISEGRNPWIKGIYGSIVYGGSELAIKATKQIVEINSELGDTTTDGGSEGNNGEADSPIVSVDDYKYPSLNIKSAYDNLVECGYQTEVVSYEDEGEVLYDGLVYVITATRESDYVIIYYFVMEELASAAWENGLPNYINELEEDFAIKNGYPLWLKGCREYIAFGGTPNAIAATYGFVQ